jgi:hypothetical protein
MATPSDGSMHGMAFQVPRYEAEYYARLGYAGNYVLHAIIYPVVQ